MAWQLGAILLVLSGAWVLAGSVQVGTIPDVSSSWFDDYRQTTCYGNSQAEFLPGPMIAGLSPRLFSQPKCGQCLNVTCTGGLTNQDHPCKASTSVVVRIVDNCGHLCTDINLSKPAFATIADVDAGDIRVSFESVPCPRVL